MTVSIRPLADEDLEEAAVILESAFHRPGNWLFDVRFIHRLQPDGYFGAYLDGVLTGLVGAVIYPAFAYIGMMGVHQDFQHRGLGLALMQHLLWWLDDRKVPIVLLDASEAGQPLYEKLGFTPLDSIYNFQRQESQPIESLPAEVQSLSHQDIDLITAIDTAAFGTDRKKVLQALFETYPGRAFGVKDSAGQVSGYVVAQSKRIGPWVAQDAAGAELLLRAALTLPFNSSFSVYVPGTNASACDLLRRYGFEHARTNCHMVRGAGVPLDQRANVFGQVSLSLG